MRIRDIPPVHLHHALMQLLTFTTGINDAVGYLGLDGVFTGNMTGNVVILGMAVTGAEGLPVLGPALALVGFMVGAAVAGWVLRHDAPGGWTARVTVIFAVVGLLMLGLGGWLTALGPGPAHSTMVCATTLSALGMGLQAATARVVAVKDVTTVVVTSTITGLAADFFLGGPRRAGATRRVVVIVLLLLGALTGALLLNVTLGAGLIVMGVLIVAAAAVGEVHRRLHTVDLPTPALPELHSP